MFPIFNISLWPWIRCYIRDIVIIQIVHSYQGYTFFRWDNENDVNDDEADAEDEIDKKSNDNDDEDG